MHTEILHEGTIPLWNTNLKFSKSDHLPWLVEGDFDVASTYVKVKICF